MQESEFVFKIPKVRKRWQSLYCTESISDLDEMWQSSDSNNENRRFQPINSVSARRNKTECINVPSSVLVATDIIHHDKSGINNTTEKMKNNAHIDAMVECDFYPNEELLVTTHKDVDCFTVPQNKYTMGLFKELSMSPHQLDSNFLRDTSYQNESADVFMPCESPSLQKSCREGNQSWVSDNGKVFRKESVESTPECDIPSPQSPDVLIVRDESMANADSEESDVDWESITPPACRSPCDHTVPDLDDVSTVTPPGDFLVYPYIPFSSVSQIDQVLPEQDDIQNEVAMHQYHFYSATDQVLPDFY